MDKFGGDLPVAAHQVGKNEEELEHRILQEKGAHDVAATLNENDRPESSSRSSSDDDGQIRKLDSRIVKIRDSLEGDAAFAHLPEHEQVILKRQLNVPETKVTFFKLWRYASRWDLIIVAISALCAIIGGAVLPLMTVR